MRQRLTSTDMSIEELLSGRYAFTIPAYQRDYAWTRDEATQLVDDLAAVLDDTERDDHKTPYFLGTMLLVGEAAGEDAPSQDQPRLVEVVDGQQRLITLSILLAVMRDLDDGEEGSACQRLLARRSSDGAARWHLVLRPADAEFFRSSIQEPGASRRGQPATAIGESLARRNIEDVRRALRSQLQREHSVSERRALARFLRQNVRVLVVGSDDIDYAYQIFLTINDRGKRLTIEDIFRGEILGPLDREQRRRYEAIIDEIQKYREEAEPNRTKGKTFFSHLAAIDGWPRRGIIEGLKQAVEKRGGPRRFVAEVFAPMAESYLQIKGAPGAAPLPEEVEQWLVVLRWLELNGDDDWVPVAMLAIARLRNDTPALVALLRALDRFAHGLMALGCGREARRKHYAPVLKRLSEPRDLPAPDNLLAISAANQRSILRNLATRLYTVDRPTTKLVLVRADLAMSGRPAHSYREVVERGRDDPLRCTIEHVLPKGDVIPEGEWLNLFPRRAQRIRVAQCIGNLVLVTDAQNQLSGQGDFLAKHEVFFGQGQSSPFVLTEMLRGEQRWDPPAITRRYNIIMAAVKELWGLAGAVPPCPALGNVPATPRLAIDPPTSR
jgi:hypothetical protein